jgi:hypothetical protein
MNLSLSGLWSEMRLTFQDPRQGVRRVLALDLPMGARWVALLLVAIASSILLHLAILLFPLPDGDIVGEMAASPFTTTVLQAGVFTLVVAAVYWLGRMRGGRGSFADTLIVMVWLQTIMLAVQLAQLVVQILLPPASGLVSLAGLGVFLWLLTNFVAELHGFRSLPAVFGGIVVGGILLAFLLAVLLLLLVGTPVPA